MGGHYPTGIYPLPSLARTGRGTGTGDWSNLLLVPDLPANKFFSENTAGTGNNKKRK